MRTLMIHEVIGQAEKAKSKQDKIKILKQNESWALKDILRGTYDSKVKWLLPKGSPPYTANDGQHNAPSNLLKRNVDFKYFVEGGPGQKLPSYKRESIFVGLIESVSPEDALIVISMINKEPIKGLPRKVVEEAFPGLLLDNP